MRLFKRSQKGTNVVLIHIGSGSVGIAIVHISNARKPTVIWSHREYVLLSAQASGDSSRLIETTLINSCLELGNRGLQALRHSDYSNSIEHFFVSVSAPWMYTVPKTVNFSDERDFLIDDGLLESLADAAFSQTTTMIEQNEFLTSLELVPVAHAITGTIVNGYSVPDPIGKKAKNLVLAHTAELAWQKIMSILEDALYKIFPHPKVSVRSFAYTLFSVLKQRNQHIIETCIVDVTTEATEITFVRDGILADVLFMPFGSYSIAREIAHASQLPLEEAYSFLKSGESQIISKLSSARQKEVEDILKSYESKVSELFLSAQDELSVPPYVYVHCEHNILSFFKSRVERALSSTDGAGMAVAHAVTPNLFQYASTTDSALTIMTEYLMQSNV